MSRFSSALFFSASLALSGLGAPLAFAQTSTAAVVASQFSPVASHPARVGAQMMQTAADTCFTEDLVPNDESSMLTVCGANGPATVIFAQ